MRDGEYLTMAYFKFDKLFCFRYMCVVSCMISAGRVCPPVDNPSADSQETTVERPTAGPNSVTQPQQSLRVLHHSGIVPLRGQDVLILGHDTGVW